MHRDGQYEQDIEGEEPMIVAGARQHLAGGQAAAHGVEDGGEVDRDREGQHRGGCALGNKEDCGHSLRPSARLIIARFSPAIE